MSQDPEKRAVLVARERHKVDGQYKTVAAIAKTENEASFKAFVKKHVAKGTTVSADENRSYHVLYAS